jgi:hypothetical protein
VRLSLPDGTTSALAVHAVDAIWLDSSDFALIDADGHLDACDIAGQCNDVRPLASPTTSIGEQWLIAPLSNVGASPQQPRTPTETTAPTRSRNVR